MLSIKNTLMSSVIKKVVMAVTGCVLASFLLIHMLGNLQALEGGPHAINAYANFLQTLPWEILWGFRLTLVVCLILHFSMAALLVLENSKARPQKYSLKTPIIKSPAAYTMIYTGIIILAFAAIHILHYTVQSINPEFKTLEWHAESGAYEGKVLHDVYAMMILGFSNNWVSAFYIVAMAAIGLHITHGVSSMFQSVGLRTEAVRYKLNLVAALYAIVVFGGFSLNPIAVLVSKYTPLEILPVKSVVEQFEVAKANKQNPIFIKYEKTENAVKQVSQH